jgi:two-component system, chemotaxis family, chemotaxis protein CheY
MPNGNRPGPQSLTVLIVDDSAMMRAMIKRVALLTEVPIAQVLEAGNGVEALQMLEGNAVDVLFTDINMPLMTGPELLREVDKRQEWSHIVRVVVSTDGSQARRQEMATLKAHAYLEKPFRPEVMRDVLAQIVSSGS